MLIFDKFDSLDEANEAALRVSKLFKRQTWVCENQEQSNEIDPFPYRLTPPMLLVEREDDDYEFIVDDEYDQCLEDFICEWVNKWGGNFAGT